MSGQNRDCETKLREIRDHNPNLAPSVVACAQGRRSHSVRHRRPKWLRHEWYSVCAGGSDAQSLPPGETFGGKAGHSRRLCVPFSTMNRMHWLSSLSGRETPVDTKGAPDPNAEYQQSDDTHHPSPHLRPLLLYVFCPRPQPSKPPAQPGGAVLGALLNIKLTAPPHALTFISTPAHPKVLTPLAVPREPV